MYGASSLPKGFPICKGGPPLFLEGFQSVQGASSLPKALQSAILEPSDLLSSLRTGVSPRKVEPRPATRSEACEGASAKSGRSSTLRADATILRNQAMQKRIFGGPGVPCSTRHPGGDAPALGSPICKGKSCLYGGLLFSWRASGLYRRPPLLLEGLLSIQGPRPHLLLRRVKVSE